MKKYRTHKTLSLLFTVIIVVSVSLKLPEILLYIDPDVETTHISLYETSFGALLLFLSMYYMFLRPLIREIESRTTLEKKLLEIEMNNRAVIAALPDNILRLSGDGTLLDYKSGQQDYLHSENNKKIADILHQDIASKLMERVQTAIETGSVQTFEVQMPSDDNVVQHKECRLAKCGDNSVIAIVRDITDQKNNENNLWYMSTHDFLTGLFNRTFFETEIENFAQGRGFPVSFIVVDIDGLKETNDNRGHAAGDKLICAMAKVLKKAFRADDIVARIGGDEFAVMLPKSDSENVELSVERIYRCFENEKAQQTEITLSFSLGSATADNSSVLVESLKLADERMYQNKLERKKQRDFDSFDRDKLTT